MLSISKRISFRYTSCTHTHTLAPKQIWKECSERERKKRTWTVCKSIHCYFVYRSILFGYISRYYKNITIATIHTHPPSLSPTSRCDVLWDGNLWAHIKFLIAFHVYSVGGPKIKWWPTNKRVSYATEIWFQMKS